MQKTVAKPEPYISDKEMTLIMLHLVPGLEEDIIYAIREYGVAKLARFIKLPHLSYLSEALVVEAMKRVNARFEMIGFCFELYMMFPEDSWSERGIYYRPKKT